MCLITTKLRNVATEDIVCYKLMLGCRTPYRQAFVDFEDSYYYASGTETITSNQYGIFKIDKGFVHTFKSIAGANYDRRIFDLRTSFSKEDLQIWECIIPKGTEYFEGTFKIAEGFASKKIKFIKIVD